MEPGAEIAQLVDEMEQLLEEAKSPLTGGAGRKIIEVNDFYEILDEMRNVFPDEFQTARRIIKEEQETLDRAQQQADAIRDQADQYERDTRYNAEEYADTVLAHLEENLKSLTNTVTRVRQTLDENSGPRNTTNNVPW